MRILLLSYCFPPVPLIEAQVTAKVSAHLDAEVDVIAAAPDLWRLPADRSLDDFVDSHFTSVTRVGRAGARHLVAAHRRVPLLGRRPDPLRYLNRQVLAELERRRLSDYDLLVTRSQFHSIHLVPRQLKVRPPWVAHFSDPWAGNPTRRDGRIMHRLNQQLESGVLEEADHLVFTSERAAEFTLARYSPAVRAKTSWVPHCFVPTLFERDAARAAMPPDAPVLARHVGHLRWNRHPEPLFRSLLALEQLSPGALKALRVELVGLISPAMLESPTAQALPTGLITPAAPVDYRASLQAMAGAELLLVTETAATHGIDLHAKIVDYAGTGVPIVGITPGGPTAELILSLGGWHGRPEHPEEGARALLHGLREAKHRRASGGLKPWGEPTVRARYSAASVGAQLAEIYARCAGLDAELPSATST